MGPGTETQRVPTPGRPLIETEADEVSSGRVWVRKSPIGYVCIGLGPSAKLARFAFEDVAPSHPFYDACRRHERDIRREGLAKVERLGIDYFATTRAVLSRAGSRTAPSSSIRMHCPARRPTQPTSSRSSALTQVPTCLAGCTDRTAISIQQRSITRQGIRGTSVRS